MGYKWKPLQRAVPNGPYPDAVLQAVMEAFYCNREEAILLLVGEDKKFRAEYWINDLYQVLKNYVGENFVQLNIRRRDGAPIIRDWRHFQQIKNELVGPECEGLELYPAESRKQDTCNKYHLWCCTDPEIRFPIGFNDGRHVVETEVRGPPGLRQRAT